MKKNYILFVLVALFGVANLSFAAQTVKLRVQVPAETKVVYAAGGFNGWSTSATPMAKVQDSPMIFEADISVPDNVDAGYNFKFLAGPDWQYEQADPSADFTFGAVGFTGAVVKSFKKYFTPQTPRDIKVNVMVPKSTLYCYITGSFVNWEQPSKEMTFVSEDTEGKYYTYTVKNIDPQLLDFKFASGPSWAYEQTQSANFSYYGNGGANNEVSVICSGFKSIFDPVNVGDITVNITSVPAGTDSVYLVGSFGGGWNMNEAIPAVKNANGTFTAVIKNIADVEYKCWNRKDWAYEECQADGSNLPSNRSAKFKDTPVVNIVIENWKKMASGVENVKFDYPITIINNTISVSGVQTKVNLFNVNGQLLQSFKGNGDFSSKVLPIGVYVLQVDKAQIKVIVD